ncbi:Brevican core protein, partial [Orchesella cincta]
MYLRVFILVAVAAQLFVKAERKNGLHNFVNLGQVDGKSYFYENTYPFFRNWTESGNYCKETGMELATIETVAEAEFLKSKYDPYGFNGWYWTGGRDAQLPRQFTWNSTGTVPTDSIGLDWEIY